MPLVVPGVMTSGSNNKEEWTNKLVGKKITEGAADNTSFAKQDLPNEHRVIKEGDVVTQDHNPNRMNIYVGNDDTVRKVEFK